MPDFKIANDPRITRVGWFLRKTSLNELPQIFTVLRGDMTRVGPPRLIQSLDLQFVTHHPSRAQPGLTGLWQIGGRNELDFDERVRLDNAYPWNEKRAIAMRLDNALRLDYPS